MLMIILHNRQDYLKSLLLVMKKKNILNTTIIEKKNIGSHLIGKEIDFIFHKGKILNSYDKALVSAIKNEEKVKHLLDLISATSRLLNLADTGFICTVPFQYIKHLRLEASYIKQREEFEIKIGDYLKQHLILLELKARNKEEAIKELATLLIDTEEVTDFKNFLKEILAREKLNTTGIGNEIAIPHTRSNVVKDFVIALGISKKGVNFNSLDNKPAKLIFMMGTPKEKGVKVYLNILSHLSRLLQKQSFRNSLLKASNTKEIINQFKKAEK